MILNEKKIKIVGISNIPKELELGKSVDLTIKDIDIDSSQDNDNQDGTFDRTYKLKISEKSEINIILEKEVIRAHKKGSQAKIQRFILEQIAEKYNLSGDEIEEYYAQRMSEHIKSLKSELDEI